MFNTIIFALLSSCYTLLIQAEGNDTYDGPEPELEGPNICKKIGSYNVEVITTEMQNYQVRTPSWCLSVPPRCAAYSFKERIVNKTQSITKSRIVKECCKGYKRAGSLCQPDCMPKCQHGACVAPNKCVCDQHYVGPVCDIICKCKNNSSCDPQTGRCICLPGWTGEDCSQPCEEGTYGMGCKDKCPNVVHSNKSCHHITGEIVCRDGYIGLACEHPCPAGYYGYACTKACSCANGVGCNHITGTCRCTPGWTGLSCNVSCEDGYFGTHCAQKCRCLNEAKCRRNDGRCICQDGWMGQRCEELCPDGFYGPHCMLLCSCPSPNFACDAIQGCKCRDDFTGENCDVPTVGQHIQGANLHYAHARIAWGSALAILFAVIIIVVVCYYQNQVSNLKTEIAYVQYTGDPTCPDHRNFNNPAYGLANIHGRCLLNNVKPKINNVSRGRTEFYIEDSYASSKDEAASYPINYNDVMLAKNLNFDLTNLNLYKSLNFSKEEHEPRKIFKEPINNYKKIVFPDNKESNAINHIRIHNQQYECDHLDNSRPSTSERAHYHCKTDSMITINRDEEKLSNLNMMNLLLRKCEAGPSNDIVVDVDENDNNNAGAACCHD
ncbi:protein draper-like [Glossina fuscipes]|uniref:Protein draper-like n=1 Tax=Glossina fuscipes TaxID=7396 RepID=A0A8U0W9G8_9MUSC|nr:protein draper-like [Glossina fuscipes]KAI9585727.1 hypothetical protein GQX74_001574 [Glossina fuscipes]